MGDVSEACLLDYIYCSGGKVTNTDLLKTYKPYISHSDLHLREKYLVLKKKYKQLMQERESKSGAEAEAEAGRQCDLTELRSWAPARQPSPTSMDVEQSRKPALVAWCEAPAITVSEAQVEEPIEDVSIPCLHLDPIEKEWMYSAACGRLPHLTQLLKQDASLANKKVTRTALHWAAKHGKQDMAVAMADAGADVNTKAVSHGYTPLHIAALHGHRHIIDLLITTYGAKENLRDYSGHLASHYLNIQKTVEEPSDLSEAMQSFSFERRNRKLSSLFHSRKKWGSAEELAPVPEERTAPQQLTIPAFRPRKFSR
uniref:SOWAHA-C winged helix-turn-helix domain-containing protein n=1 Tax=Electrophorus electricus TaxID=8005 RepID=A0A4W4HKC5_ELEEL